jgi:type IV secretory pathway TrbL component
MNGASFARSVAAALLLAACGGSGERPAAHSDSAARFETQVAEAIEEASANGASERQLDLLDLARDEGEVTIEVARQAMRAYSDCAADAGVKVWFKETTRPDGWTNVLTMIDVSSGTNADAVASACERKESWWVTFLYSTQPSTVEGTEAYLDSQAPVLRSCLEDAGFATEDDMTGMELAILSTQGDDQASREAGSHCLTQIGVDGF